MVLKYILKLKYWLKKPEDISLMKVLLNYNVSIEILEKPKLIHIISH